MNDAKTWISVPGKTFLLGEYLVLKGGPALLVATEPRFACVVSPTAANRSNCNLASRIGIFGSGFHPDSPAGRIADEQFFKQYDFEFIDPHFGRGGLGASGAQFILLRAAQDASRHGPSGLLAESATELALDYWAQFKKLAPAQSGADIIAQVCGGLTYWDPTAQTATKCEWDFADLSFTLLRTGKKLDTHAHLKSGIAIPVEDLSKAVAVGKRALDDRDASGFIDAFQACGEALRAAGLLADHSGRLIEALCKELGSVVLAVKGCGALGADVICVLHRPSERNKVVNWAVNQELEIVGSDKQISTGLKVWEPSLGESRLIDERSENSLA